MPNRVYPEIGKGRIDERNVGTNVRYNKPLNENYNKPLNENYEDELVEKLEKMRIAKLEKQVRNMERELNNNGNKDQLNQRRNNRAPINYDEIICFRCNRRGHFATRCPLGNNIRRNERRVNLMNIEDHEEDYDHESEESDDDYDHENNEYDNLQLYRWKNFGKPNLDKDIEERGKEEYKYRNREEIPMELEEDEQPMNDKLTGPGINRWREAGGKRRPRKDNIIGVRSKDPVDYGNLLNIVEQQEKMIKRMLKKGEKVLELENDKEIIDIPVWYIKRIEESEESDYESESEKSDYEQEEEKKLYTVKEVIKEKEVVKENESQEDSESSSEESSSDNSEISSENED
ncbi:unnamed protein product [Rhizophagus irregularis]|nr:unnamed protein product [Rhizophagus irregularis]